MTSKELEIPFHKFIIAISSQNDLSHFAYQSTKFVFEIFDEDFKEFVMVDERSTIKDGSIVRVNDTPPNHKPFPVVPLQEISSNSDFVLNKLAIVKTPSLENLTNIESSEISFNRRDVSAIGNNIGGPPISIKGVLTHQKKEEKDFRDALINSAMERYSDFQLAFKSKNKKVDDIWEKVACSMKEKDYPMDGERCRKKFVGMLEEYRKILKHGVRDVRSGQILWPQFSIFHNLNLAPFLNGQTRNTFDLKDIERMRQEFKIRTSEKDESLNEDFLGDDWG